MITVARIAVLWVYLAGVVTLTVGCAVRGAEEGKLRDPMWLGAGLLLVAGWPVLALAVLARPDLLDRSRHRGADADPPR